MEQATKLILKQLDAIEIAHKVTILYAIESGSRAWGFASPDSDFDVRFIYVRPVLDYLRIRPMRDVIELPLTGDLDTNGWDIIKALNLFRSSNPALLEWLRSPIVYLERGEFAVRLRRLAGTHASARRMSYHYLSMARGQYKDFIADRAAVSLKKYLYALRPILCLQWIEQQGLPVPTAVSEILSSVALPRGIDAVVQSLLERKRAAIELGQAPAIPELDAYLITEIERFERIVPELPDQTIDTAVLDSLLHTTLGMGVA